MLEALILVIAVYISLILSSIPLWIASKILGVRKSSIGRAVVATFGGGLLSVLVLFLTTPIAPINFLLALIAYLWALKIIYDISWLHALLLLIVSVLVVVVILAILSVLALIPAFIVEEMYKPPLPPGPPWA